MRKLWEADEIQTWDASVVDKQNYDDLVNRLNELAAEYEKSIIDFDTYKQEIERAFTTATLSCTQLTSGDIDVENLEASVADIVHLTVNEIISSQSLTTPLATIDRIISNILRVDSIDAKNISSDELSAIDAEITNLVVDNINIRGEQSINNADITTLHVDDLNVTQADIQSAEITNLSSFDIDATNIQVDDISAEDANIQSGSIDTLTTTSILRNKYITISPDFDDCVVSIPYFTNGSYRMVAIDSDNNPIWHITIYNEEDNYRVHWSQRDDNIKRLEDLYIYQTPNQSRIYIRVHILGISTRVFYQMVSAVDSQPNPMTFETYEDAGVDVSSSIAWHYEFKHRNGNFFQRQLDQVNNSGEHVYASLELFNQPVYDETEDYLNYDGLRDEMFHVYRPDQSLNTDDDVSHKNLTIEEHTTTNTLTTNNTTKLNRHIYVGSLSNLASFDLGENAVGVIYE